MLILTNEFLSIYDIDTFAQTDVQSTYLTSLQVKDITSSYRHLIIYILNGSWIRVYFCHISRCDTQIVVTIGRDAKIRHLLKIRLYDPLSASSRNTL